MDIATLAYASLDSLRLLFASGWSILSSFTWRNNKVTDRFEQGGTQLTRYLADALAGKDDDSWIFERGEQPSRNKNKRYPPSADELYSPILKEASDFVAGQRIEIAPAASANDFDDLKNVFRLTRESNLGGIPLYRPDGVEGDVLPLYDMTHAGNLKELEGLSKINLPERIYAPLEGNEAIKMRKALKSHPRIEIIPDTTLAISVVAGIYARSFEAAVTELQKAQLAATSIAAPPGRVDLEVEANTPGIRLYHWKAHIVRMDQYFGKVDAQLIARRQIDTGYYRFCHYASSGVVKDEPGSYRCFPSNPKISLGTI